MKIAYISAGAAGMYCGSCIHDNTLASALIALGQEVALVPTYTPTRTDEDNVSIDRVFLGGVNLYLQHKSPLFGRLPRVLTRLLDRPLLLSLVSRLSSSTNAQMLGGLTSDLLHGEEGNLRRELQALVTWLRDSYRPDIVELTNTLFLGLAREIRRQVRCPVVCGVQGEDLFLEQLTQPYRDEILSELRKRAQDVDAFIATSRYYAEHMSRVLDIPLDRFHVVPLGINVKGHGSAGKELDEAAPFSIGYLARICPEKGLHLLAEAFRILAQRHGPGRLRLRAAGWLGDANRGYLKEVEERLRDWGLADRWEYVGEVDRVQKIDFLRSLDLLSVPTVYREAKGLFVLEALANRVPVVVPSHGSFPEMLEATGGGLLVEPGSPEALAAAIEELMQDGPRRLALGQAGHHYIHSALTEEHMARNTLRVYERFVGKGKKPQMGQINSHELLK